MDSKTFCDLVEAAGYSCRSYSGRGMFGKNCVGIDIRRGDSVFALATALCREAVEFFVEDDMGSGLGDWIDFINDLNDLRPSMDSMGLDLIVYFPELRWPAGRANSDSGE